jgi:hypothetical protein
MIADAHDEDGTISAYEWWFSKKYNCGRNEPDTITTQPTIDIDAARCTANVRLEIVDNYKARFYLTMNKDSITAKPAPKLDTKIISKINHSELTVTPNPFNPTAMISFTSEEKGIAVLSIFDVKGTEIVRKTLLTDKGQSIKYVWNSASDRNKQLAAGTYLIVLKMGTKRLTKKAILLR